MATDATLHGVTEFDGTYFAAASDGTVLRFDTGQGVTAMDAILYGIAASDDLLVAVGANGSVLELRPT